MQLLQLIPAPYPFPPHAEGNLDLLAEQHRLEELMEKLQKLKESLVLMLAAVKDARNQLENHLQHVHSTLNPRGEVGMGAGARMGASGYQHQALAPCPAGQSSSVISTCILYGSYFMLLVSLLVPTLPRVTILLLFLISSALSGVLSIPELSSLLALALTGGDGCWEGMAGDTSIWGCSVLSHPLCSP